MTRLWLTVVDSVLVLFGLDLSTFCLVDDTDMDIAHEQLLTVRSMQEINRSAYPLLIFPQKWSSRGTAVTFSQRYKKHPAKAQ